MKNEAASSIPIEVYTPPDLDSEDNLVDPNLEPYKQTSWFQETEDWLQNNPSFHLYHQDLTC